MRRLVVLAALSVLFVPILFVGTSGAHNTRIDTTLSINRSPTGVVGSGNDVVVFGKLRPGRCADGQRVRVFRAGPGTDESLGSDNLDGDGEYGVTIRPTSDMNVYARVGRAVIRNDYGHRHVCRGDRSGNIHIEVN